jgi:hypothetical protein
MTSSVGKDVDVQELSNPGGGKANWYDCFREQLTGFLKS